jgi:prepilin-type N-terminal cleavage/methylation domain-containing protein
MAFMMRGTAARKSMGMTMIELLVGMTVVGIGMTIAIPGFQGMIARNNLATQVNEFLLTVNRALLMSSVRAGALSMVIRAIVVAGSSCELRPCRDKTP